MQEVRLLPKNEWKSASGAFEKARRLHLIADENGCYNCPVQSCDSSLFKSQRGCRKHVSIKHGWYYYFDVRPSSEEFKVQKAKFAIVKPFRSRTTDMPMFSKNCTLHKDFSKWLTSPVGGGKSEDQATQISVRTLKYMKFCCEDMPSDSDFSYCIVDYYVVSMEMIGQFIDYTRNEWRLGYPGILGYMHALTHLLDFRRMNKADKENNHLFLTCEVYLSRIKKTLSRKMSIEWNTVLSIDHLTKINCWATLEEIQQVIPFHSNRFAQIMINLTCNVPRIGAHELSFCTSFIVAVLFILVKAARPMLLVGR